jgi:protein SCO1/2
MTRPAAPVLAAPAFGAIVLAASLLAGPARADGKWSVDDAPSTLPPAAQAVDLDEHLGRAIDAALPLTDQRGRRVTLGDYLGGRAPIVLVLAYYRCPMLCGLVLRGVVRGLEQVRFALGADYHALTVSIDPRDKPDEARLKRASTLAALSVPEASSEWPFLVGDAPAVQRLADEVGFRYAYDARTDQYAHPAAAIVLTPDGHVSRYLYGIDFPARDLRLALVEAGQGRTGTIVDRVILTCYRFDPAMRAYGPTLFGFLRLGAALILAAVTLTLALLFRHERRRRVAGGAP